MAKLQAWLTPNMSDTQEVMVSRTICLPWPLLNYLSGAFLALCEEWNWEEYGDMTKEEIADFFKDIFDNWVVSDMAYVGQISAFVVVPDCWLVMSDFETFHDGALYPELYAILPASMKSGSFIKLPAMTGVGLVGHGVFPPFNLGLGSKIGAATHTLLLGEIPSHGHDYTPPVYNIDLESPGAPDIQGAGVGTSIKTGANGGGQPHNNMPPSLGVKWAIYAGRKP